MTAPRQHGKGRILGRTAEPPNRRTAEPPNRRTAEAAGQLAQALKISRRIGAPGSGDVSRELATLTEASSPA
jgi:hypothetical protein